METPLWWAACILIKKYPCFLSKPSFKHWLLTPCPTLVALSSQCTADCCSTCSLQGCTASVAGLPPDGLSQSHAWLPADNVVQLPGASTLLAASADEGWHKWVILRRDGVHWEATPEDRQPAQQEQGWTAPTAGRMLAGGSTAAGRASDRLPGWQDDPEDDGDRIQAAFSPPPAPMFRLSGLPPLPDAAGSKLQQHPEPASPAAGTQDFWGQPLPTPVKAAPAWNAPAAPASQQPCATPQKMPQPPLQQHATPLRPPTAEAASCVQTAAQRDEAELILHAAVHDQDSAAQAAIHRFAECAWLQDGPAYNVLLHFSTTICDELPRQWGPVVGAGLQETLQLKQERHGRLMQVLGAAGVLNRLQPQLLR